tara:strand:+ start:230 stop:625 length:396 start_codon:yes stop_codon:yes gene_type:complete
MISFIYDGECPFCNHFAELIELKSGLKDIQLINGRKNLAMLTSLYKQGYDLNEGAILINNGQILQGSIAINWICSQINSPSDTLLKILSMVFASKKRSEILFPLLVWSRRFILLFKEANIKPVSDHIQFYS